MAAWDRGDEYCDPARKEDFCKNNDAPELWEEHLEDPIIALDKTLKCSSNALPKLLSTNKNCVDKNVNSAFIVEGVRRATEIGKKR